LADGGQDPGGFGCSNYNESMPEPFWGLFSVLFLLWGLAYRRNTSTGA